ncbi:MAG: RNA methyltransferase [Prevotella sp.]|nr:RNA methyltransferase [Prevotella sp.]
MEEFIITSVQNARIKHVVALQQKSALRREEGRFVVEGQREIEHCIACGYEITEIFYCPDYTGEQEPSVNLGQIYTGFLSPCVVSAAVYEKMAYREGTEGVIAVAKCKEHRLKDLQLPQNPLIVVLESVEKPGNLGAILRTAEGAHVDAVIVCDPLTDLYNPNLIRASIGGVFSVPTAVCTSKECIAFLKANKIRILTAQLQDSYDYYDYNMCGATAIVMGTESTGLTNIWREAADVHIRIPMLGRLDSLNVSVSAAILMYEAVRQRNKVYQHPDARM